MFSPNELLHLVFANDDDIYYCDNLLKLDLNQYLWWVLHREGYRTVCFLNANKDIFSVKTYGDVAYSPYPTEDKWFKRFIKSDTEKFGEWMTRQMKAKSTERVAFVCPLHEFCDTARGEEWTNLLRKIASIEKRTGIILLTVPAEVEQSRDLLLSSKVFDALHEVAVTNLRNDDIRPLYASLAIGKPYGVTYLNGYTTERLKALLLHVMMDGDDCFAAGLQIERCAEYLTQYLNNPWLRRYSPLFGTPKCNEYPEYRELYHMLMNKQIWDNLLKATQKAFDGGNLREWLNQLQCPYIRENDMQVCVMRDRNNFAGRCMKLWPLQSGDAMEEAGKSDEAFELLIDIYTALRSPKNKADNPKIAAVIESLLAKLEVAQGEGDFDTYKRVLFSIRFCVQWLHVPGSSDEEKSIISLSDSLKVLINCSQEHFRTANQLRRYEMQTAFNQVAEAELTYLKGASIAAKTKLATLEELVMASIVKLSVHDSANQIKEMAADLQEQIESFECEEPLGRQKEEPPMEPETELYLHDQPLKAEEDDILLGEGAYIFRPPKLDG